MADTHVTDCTTGETSHGQLENPPGADEVEALAWAQLRADRDARLAATDFTQLADTPEDIDGWATYRQQLRDLPDVTSDPASPDWPEPPA